MSASTLHDRQRVRSVKIHTHTQRKLAKGQMILEKELTRIKLQHLLLNNKAGLSEFYKTKVFVLYMEQEGKICKAVCMFLSVC